MKYLGSTEKEDDIATKKYVDSSITSAKGTKVVVQSTQPTDLKDKDLWYKII